MSPKLVDHDQRRLEIVLAAIDVIGRHGVEGLSLRRVAQQMGGSLSVVTHYFSHVGDLVAAIPEVMVAAFRQQMEVELDLTLAPRDLIRSYLLWLLPQEDEVYEVQLRAHMAILASEDAIGIRSQLVVFDDLNREVLCPPVCTLLGDGHAADLAVDLLLAFVRGVALLRLSAPERFDLARQVRLLDELLARLF